MHEVFALSKEGKCERGEADRSEGKENELRLSIVPCSGRTWDAVNLRRGINFNCKYRVTNSKHGLLFGS